MSAIHPLGGGFRILSRQVARTLAAQAWTAPLQTPGQIHLAAPKRSGKPCAMGILPAWRLRIRDPL